MGYRVGTSGKGFKLLFESFVDGVRQARGIPKTEWGRLGLRPEMSILDAKAIVKILNLGEKIKLVEKRRLKIKERLDKETVTLSVFLPMSDIAEFEATNLSHSTSKQLSHWNQCKRLLAKVSMPVSDWEALPYKFYQEFLNFKMSPAYVQKCVSLLNLWGVWYARRYKLPFLPLPRPVTSWKNRIAEAHYNKDASRGNKTSDPLTPLQLESVKASLKPEQYLWLAFSVWFGLRPIEIDLLSKPTSKKTWWIDHQQGLPILWVYQTKLKGVHPDKRVKYIPCITKEQQYLVTQIGNALKRPLPKTMINLFAGNITLYGGRKGFTSLMKSLDQPFELISSWLGHTNISRTYSSYFDRNEVRFKKIA